jgi:hypothetical protein
MPIDAAKEIDEATSRSLKPAIHLLIVTATDVETEAVLARMEPFTW